MAGTSPAMTKFVGAYGMEQASSQQRRATNKRVAFSKRNHGELLLCLTTSRE
jgi:hypothetical protein